MPRVNGFGRAARLVSGRDFKRVFSAGRKTPGRNLTLWSVVADTDEPPRLGLSVSGKVGNAPRRNRLKRLAREAFRLNRFRFRPGIHLVVCVRPQCSWSGRQAAQTDLLNASQKAGLLNS